MKTKRVYHWEKGIEKRRDGKSFMGIFYIETPILNAHFAKHYQLLQT